MPTVENYTEHPYSFPRGPIAEKALTIPRGTGGSGAGPSIVKPSVTIISDDDLKAMREHPVARTWFNRDGLVVVDAPVPKAGKQ